MSTPLDSILAAIDANRTLDQVAERVDRARNRFPHNADRVTDMEAFADLLGRFFAHVEAEVLRSKLLYEVDPGLYQYRAEELLGEAYGAEGVKVGLEMARRGGRGRVASCVERTGGTAGAGVCPHRDRGPGLRLVGWSDGC